MNAIHNAILQTVPSGQENLGEGSRRPNQSRSIPNYHVTFSKSVHLFVSLWGLLRKMGWGVKGHAGQAGGCKLQFGSKVKACQGWSSKENWETQKEDSRGREVEAGAGREAGVRGLS